MKVSRRGALGFGAVVVAASVLGYVVHRHAKMVRAERFRAVDVGAICRDALPLGPRCAPCVAVSCCTELAACYGSSECIDLNDCWVKSGEDEGQALDPFARARRCEKAHPSAQAAFHAWDDCMHARCEDECPRSGPGETE